MDIAAAGMSGLEAVEQIMSVRPTPILVLSAQVTADGEIAAAALAAGALEAIGKDELAAARSRRRGGDSFRRRVKLLSGARVIRHPRGRLTAGSRNRDPELGAPRRRSSAICASTGGPQALATVLSAIPDGLSVADPRRAAHRSRASPRAWHAGSTTSYPCRCGWPSTGATATAGVTVAPDGAHLVLRPGSALLLDRQSPAGLHRPSADVLLASIASSCEEAPESASC